MAVFTAIGAAIFGAGTFGALATAAALQIATGIAVSLVSHDEGSLLRDIEKLLRKSIPTMPLPKFAPAPPPLRTPPRAGTPSTRSAS